MQKTTDLENLSKHIESLIFTTDKALSEKDLKAALDKTFKQNINKDEISSALESLQNKYKSDEFAIEVVGISGGYRFMTKAAYHDTISSHLTILNKKNLSKAALETLAIIAYKQPIVKSEIESIRGVGCDYSIQKLLEKELIEMVGRSSGPGRPMEYGTTEKFLDHFGIKEVKDLPQLKELKQDNELLGEQAPIEYDSSIETMTEEE